MKGVTVVLVPAIVLVVAAAMVSARQLAHPVIVRAGERVMVRGQIYDAPTLLESVKGKMGPATAADDGWWKGNTRFPSGGGAQ